MPGYSLGLRRGQYPVLATIFDRGCLSKKFKKFFKKALPFIAVAAAIWTGGTALGLFGGGAAATGGASSIGGGLAAKAAATTATKVSAFGSIAAAAKTAQPIFSGISAISQASSLLSGPAKTQVVQASAPSVIAQNDTPAAPATSATAEVEEEERRRRAAAAAGGRSTTIRAGSLAARPSLGAAGSLG